MVSPDSKTKLLMVNVPSMAGGRVLVMVVSVFIVIEL
jgi:hypothetical protein